MAWSDAATVFRDYNTDGVPGSGAKSPVKSEIRALLAGVPINVLGYAGVVGDGVNDDYTGIMNAYADAVSQGTGLFWPPGNYKVSQMLDFGDSHTKHVNYGGVTITFTGTGVAISFNAGTGPSDHLWNVSFGSRECPFRVIGNASATIGIFAQGLQHSSIFAITRDFSTCGLSVNFAVLSRFFVEMSINDEGSFNVNPTAALITARRGAGEFNTDCQFEVIAEGIHGTGLQLAGTQASTFIGTSEGNVNSGGGVYEGAECLNNRFVLFDCESNAGADWTLDGSGQTHLDMCVGASTTGLVMTGANRVRVSGGSYNTISVNSGSANCFLDYVGYITSFTINSTTTGWRRVYDGSAVFIADRKVGGLTLRGDAIYTVKNTDRVVVINAALTTTRAFTLPALSTMEPGQTITFIDAAATLGSNNVTLTRAGSDTFTGGGTTYSFNTNKGTVVVVADPTDSIWHPYKASA